jgi:hypothetical protein
MKLNTTELEFVEQYCQIVGESIDIGSVSVPRT